MLIGAAIGVNVGLKVSFHRLFCLSVVGQLLTLGLLIAEALRSAPVFAVLLTGAFALQLANGVLLLGAGSKSAPVPWPLLRWLFTGAATVLTLRVASIALPQVASGAVLAFLLTTAFLLLPALGQVALMWWPGSGDRDAEAEAR